jgi:hypothetical protein
MQINQLLIQISQQVKSQQDNPFFAVVKFLSQEVLFCLIIVSRCGGISGTNSQFFRTAKNAKTASVVEQNRVWLNLFNNEGAFKQALVGYVTGATNNFEWI